MRLMPARFYFAILFVCGVFIAGKSSAGPVTPLSTLSDGSFERQLDVPPHTVLEQGSPQSQAAATVYQTMPFGPSERMRYIVTYLGVSGGSAEVILHPPVKYGDSWAHRMTGEVKSASWYRWIMNIHDSIEVLMNNGTEFTPARFYINQMEGSFRQSKIVEFEPPKGVLSQITKRKGRDEKRATFPFVTGTKDALGSLYYIRNQLASKNPPPTQMDVPIFTSEKNWTGKATYLGSDTKKIGKKSYEADVYRLITTFGGLMEQKGDIKMWFSRDERRLPLYIEATVRFGYIKVTLNEWDPSALSKARFEPIRHDL